MAYTIISQNNTTTTLSDENGNVITVPARVTLATSTDYTITKVNNNSVDLEDGDGKIIRGVPACVVLAGEGGGGVSSVNGQTGAVTVSEVPDQTGQSGKFLTTNGTDASWSDKPLVNKAQNGKSAVAIGKGTQENNSGYYSILIDSVGGSNYSTGTNSIAIKGSCDGRNNIAIGGKVTGGNQGGIAFGEGATVSAVSAIQICSDYNNPATNSDANTFKVANANGNFEIMSADGTVPHGRLTNAVVSNAVTIAVADWNGGTTCTKTISGLTATSVVWVAPDNASQSDYLTAGVYASAQTTDTITFTCTTTPTSALTVNVIYC